MRLGDIRWAAIDITTEEVIQGPEWIAVGEKDDVDFAVETSIRLGYVKKENVAYFRLIGHGLWTRADNPD